MAHAIIPRWNLASQRSHNLASQRSRPYELTLVLSPEASSEEVSSITQQSTDFINDRGGSVSETDEKGIRRLSYPIKRFQEGNYVVTRFTLDSKELPELTRSLNASESVLRYLCTLAKPTAE